MERESRGFATTLWGRIKTWVTQNGTDVRSGKATCVGPHRLDLVTEEGPYRSGPCLDQQHLLRADRTSHTCAQTART